MEQLLLVFVSVLLGIGIHAVVTEVKRFKAIKELDETIDRTLSSLREKIIPSRIEEENGMLFLYNKNTNEFLGQGKSLIELEKTVREKYPDRLFNVTQAELDKFNKEPHENV